MKRPVARRRELYALLGDLPPRGGKIAARKVAEERRENYVLEKLLLDLNGLEPVPAYFTRPLEAKAPGPAVLFNHSHGGKYDMGKRELLLSHEYLPNLPYAEELARMGCAALAIDHWGFGERRGRSEGEIFKEMLWHGRVLWGMMVFDSLRAIDYLASRPEVDPKRIATLGISMGSTMAWWVAALDERVKVTIDLCCLTDFEALIETRGLDGHGIYYYVPSLLKHFATGEINALIAPRPHLGLAGNYDRLTPPAGLDRIDAHLKKVYKAAGAPEAWKLLRYDCGHMETAAMWAEIVTFLKRWL
jgi:hypothetical protein